MFFALEEHERLLRAMVAQCEGTLDRLVEVLITALARGNKLMICGNGGSAADAQHVAGELVNRFRMDRPALACIALTTDASVLTSVSNDYAFEDVFARQVEALARPQDVVAGMSTSGRSVNVLRALSAARRVGAMTVGLTGLSGERTMAPACDICLVAPSDDTPRIQEAHMFAWHVVCARVEEAMVRAMDAGSSKVPAGRE